VLHRGGKGVYWSTNDEHVAVRVKGANEASSTKGSCTSDELHASDEHMNTNKPIVQIRGRLAGFATLFALILTLSLWLCVGALPARADGGAPNLAYIVGGGSSSDNLTVMDITQRNVAWSLALGNRPQAVVLSNDGRFAYVTEADANRVAIVDTRDHRVAGSMPTGAGPSAIAADPSGSLHWLFVADTTGNTLTVLDPDSQRVKATLPVGNAPVGVAVAASNSGISDPSTLEVYVANRQSQTVSVIATSDLRTLATIALPAPPCAINIPSTGGVAYVATCQGRVLAIGLASHQVLGTVLSDLGGTPGTMDYDAITGQIYIPVPTMDRVVILRPAGVGGDGSLMAPAEPLRTLAFSGEPSAVAITFEGALGFVAERGDGRVVELDITNGQSLGTVAVGGAPRAIVTGPYPPALDRQTTVIVVALIFAAFIVGFGILLFLAIRESRRTRRRSA
jgi:YVTN family beta-propeller protein